MAKGKKTGGRQKGTPNKLTAEVKDMVRQALDDLGGVEYLKKTAKEQPRAFLALVSKLIPQEAKVEGGDKAIEVTVRVLGD